MENKRDPDKTRKNKNKKTEEEEEEEEERRRKKNETYEYNSSGEHEFPCADFTHLSFNYSIDREQNRFINHKPHRPAIAGYVKSYKTLISMRKRIICE